MEWVILIIFIIIIVQTIKFISRLFRKRRLMSKYGDKKIVDLIIKKMFWQGQTEAQLIDSIGKPVDINQKVMKYKTRETWKYNRVGKNRFGLKIELEDGIVIGWEQ